MLSGNMKDCLICIGIGKRVMSAFKEMLNDPDVLHRRKPLWVALSDLCLDTEMTDGTIAYIARVIREQGFTFEEAERIGFEEVFPALIDNLYQVAGEWAGFNEEWVVQRILSQPEKRSWGISGYLRRRSVRAMLGDDWARVRKAYQDAETSSG